MKKITFTLLILVLLLTLVGCGHKHEYTDEVVAPTCTEKGYTKHTCECGDIYQDSEVQAKGHSFGEWNVVKEATEKEKGSKFRQSRKSRHHYRTHRPRRRLSDLWNHSYHSAPWRHLLYWRPHRRRHHFNHRHLACHHYSDFIPKTPRTRNLCYNSQ